MNKLYEYRNGNYNVEIFDDGTKIRSTNDNYFDAEFPENIDIKITNKCNRNCAFCHEDSNINGKNGDINLEFFSTLHYGTELAIGGGNIFEHKDLNKLLIKCKELKLIPNITIHQDHFMENIDKIVEYKNNKMIYGIGVSVSDVDKLIGFVSNIPNSVIKDLVLHVINGIVNPFDLNRLSPFFKKVLILGYKELRRGQIFIDDNREKVNYNMNRLSAMLPVIMRRFEVVSFDNLALKQLDIKNKIDKEIWENCYMGDDGSHTMYIDLVNEEFALSSTSLKRHKLKNNINDMFKQVKDDREG